MSDQSMGHGWWQASDGKWYSPELHPESLNEAPTTETPAAGTAQSSPPAPGTPAGQQPPTAPGSPAGHGPPNWQGPPTLANPTIPNGPAVPGAPGDGQKNRSNGLLVALGVIFVVLALGAGGCVALVVSGRQGSVKDESARSDRVAAPTTTAEYQREPSTVPETSTEPETPATTEPESPPETAPPTTLVPAPPSTKAPSSIMPDVVCMDLQQAQDTIQSAGVFFSRSFDATGAGRNQIIDRNWIVVSQDPPAGAPIDGVQPNLGAVKKNEPSPC